MGGFVWESLRLLLVMFLGDFFYGRGIFTASRCGLKRPTCSGDWGRLLRPRRCSSGKTCSKRFFAGVAGGSFGICGARN